MVALFLFFLKNNIQSEGPKLCRKNVPETSRGVVSSFWNCPPPARSGQSSPPSNKTATNQTAVKVGGGDAVNRDGARLGAPSAMAEENEAMATPTPAKTPTSLPRPLPPTPLPDRFLLSSSPSLFNLWNLSVLCCDVWSLIRSGIQLLVVMVELVWVAVRWGWTVHWLRLLWILVVELLVGCALLVLRTGCRCCFWVIWVVDFFFFLKKKTRF